MIEVHQPLGVGSLFSGIAGIELGLERTGYFKTEWFVENDGFCRKILARHWPNIPIHGDITTLDFSRLPKVDMLAGGFPCQDISYAGKGKGIREGTRSGLWSYFAEAIRVIRPKYALIENVPALANRGLDVVLAGIAEAGYDAEWFDLRASDFGALHRRERIFIVAYRDHRGRWEKGELRNGDALGGRGENSRLSSTPENKTVVANNHGDGFHGSCVSVFSGGSRQDSPRDKDGVDPNPNPIARHGIHEGQPDDERFVVADDYLQRAERFWHKKMEGKRGFSWCQDVRRVENLSGRSDIPEPLFRGARDGVPDWVDRVKSLGNAVVPDCAEFIGEMIMEYDKKGRTEGTG